MFFNAFMTLSFRNGLLTVLLVLAGAAGIFLTYSALIAGSDFGWKGTFPAQEAVLFWFLRNPVTDAPIATFLWQFLVLIPLAFVSLFYLRLLYRKTNAPELFFLSFFLFSLLGEGFRVLQLFYVLNDQSYFWSLVLTRVVWIFRLFGLFMAFSASLFALEFPYQKLGNFVGMGLGLAVFLGANLTFQTTTLDSTGLFAPGDERGLLLIFLFLSLLTLANLLFSTLAKRRPHSLSQLGSMVLFLAASQATFFGAIWAGLLLIPGTALLRRKVQDSYF